MLHQDLFDKVFAEKAGDIDVRSYSASVAERYPYFSLAHFYSAAGKADGILETEAGSEMLPLHFTNPFLLKHALSAPQVKVSPEVTDEAREQIVRPAHEVTAPVEVQVPIVAEVQEATDLTSVKAAQLANLTPGLISRQKQELSAPTGPLIFEPLHMTDYFASQGIRLTEEVNPDDKLGKQLRSFTDWLKTMKKVHESKLPAGSEQLDASVQRLAEKSNKDADIVTEAMAEAYAQQGKNAKAIETYQKLSLLNPAKSAFFAGKIEHLNNS